MRAVRRRGTGALAGTALAASIVALGPSMGARADEGQEKQSALQERCAQRLAIALTGKSALNEPSSRDGAPKGNDAQGAQGTLPTLLTSGDFQERFARFINSEFNPGPATIDLADAPYFLAKHVLTKGLPWSEMFLGQYRFAPVASNVAVFGDSDGLGYFRSRDWYQRYEGNEESGLKIATAYRIMNNVVGLQLTAVTASPNVDQSATGRKASPCNACHFNGWYALDSVASVLPKKGERFDAYRGGQKALLGGQLIGNDKELVTALVASKDFSVHACRLAFKFLYGREDNRCEGPILDHCIDTFASKKTITSALASIAGEPGFCD